MRCVIIYSDYFHELYCHFKIAVCNLGSIALSRFVVTEKKFDHDKLYEVTKFDFDKLHEVTKVRAHSTFIA